MKTLILLLSVLFTTMSFAQVPNYVPANGLVGWWPFNGNTNDESGNGNNGSNNGATLATDRNGNVNSAHSFLNQNSKISLSTITSDSITSISISGWFKKITAGIDGAIFAMSNGCNGADGPRLFIGNNNFLHWQVEKTACIGFGVYSNQINYSDNNWHFFVAIYNKTNPTYVTSDFSLYIDGINIGLSSPSSTQGIISPLSNSFFSTTIGNVNTNTNGFTGLVDDIGLWNRALTYCEIQNLYTSTNPTNLTSQTSCDSYIWNGTTYNSSGVYSGTTANCVTESLNLTINSSSSASQTQTALDTYTWSLNNQTYTQGGTYTATIPNAAGCDSVVTLNLTLNYTGINEPNSNSVSISPNPTSSKITVKSSLALVGKEFTIYDQQGKAVKSGIITAEETEIDLSNLSEGVYLFKAGADMQETFKIIKQ